MKRNLGQHVFLTLLLLGISYFSNAQMKNDVSKLLGAWVLEKQEFLEPNEDSTILRKESEGSVVTFKKGNIFETKAKAGSNNTEVYSGTYKLDADGKHLYQNDLKCEIVELSDSRLVMKVNEVAVLLRFKKL